MDAAGERLDLVHAVRGPDAARYGIAVDGEGRLSLREIAHPRKRLVRGAAPGISAIGGARVPAVGEIVELAGRQRDLDRALGLQLAAVDPDERQHLR